MEQFLVKKSEGKKGDEKKEVPELSADVVEISGLIFSVFNLSPGARLLHTPWHPDWKLPTFPVDNQERPIWSYHEISIFGRPVNQPRRTACYDYAYAYSGQVHPIETETPPEITALYEIVKRIFGVETNMCLANAYFHGYVAPWCLLSRRLSGAKKVLCILTSR